MQLIVDSIMCQVGFYSKYRVLIMLILKLP